MLCILPTIAAALFLTWNTYRGFTGQLKQRVPSVFKYDFYCQLCGLRWSWQTDQPYPNVNVNPALIQQGEQRLEEQRRQQQQQMEAAWLLQQQQKK
jgi:hypothetical protein